MLFRFEFSYKNTEFLVGSIDVEMLKPCYFYEYSEHKKSEPLSSLFKPK